jgi:hypothetical protein
VKVGPSVSDYRGEVQVVRLDPQAHEIEILGKGQDVRGKGSASMKMTGKLTATPDGGSEVASVSELSVVGILAQMGGRMIQEVSNIMFEQFVKNFQQKLQAGPGGEATTAEPADKPKPVNAIATAFSALKSVVKRRDNPPSPESPESAAASEASESSKSRGTGDDPEVKE